MAADGSAAADKALARLERLRAVLTDEVRRLVARLDTRRGEAVLESDAQALANAVRVRSQVAAMLGESRAAVIAEMNSRALDAVEEVIASLPEDFRPDARPALGLIVSSRANDITATFEDAATVIGEAMRVGITSGAELSELMDDAARIIGTTIGKVQSAVDSAIMAAGRSAIIDGGKAAEDTAGEPTVYLYVGPRDSKTRPFCAAHLRKCYTAEYLDSEDNGAEQPKPVSLYIGGYNCRHSLAPMPLSLARAKGYEVFGA